MREETKSLVTFLVSVVVAASFLNLYLYWGKFGINPYTLIDASNIFPIVAPFLAQVATLLAITYVSFLVYPPSELEHFPQNEMPLAQGHIGRFVIPAWLLLIASNLAVFFLMPHSRSLEAYLFFAGLLGVTGLLFSRVVSFAGWEALFKTSFSRRSAAFATVYLPIASIVIAFSQADDIINKRSFQYINSEDLILAPGIPNQTMLPFLGKLGETYVVTSPDFKQKIFLRPESFKILRLHDYQSTRISVW